jgi:DNA-binding MarR family transcriptional regulator
VARSHQFRDGLSLVDFGEVGLPVFRMTLEAITIAQKSMPTIHEFVMRGLALGETGEAHIARLLGLKVETVSGAVNALVSDGYVARQQTSGAEPAFKLTDAGELRLMQEREEVPQDEMLVIDYDAIRRIPFRLTGESVVRASELAVSGSVQIRPYPAEAPGIDELNLSDVSKVIRKRPGDEFRRTVLALKRTARRNNVFREAVALVYASDRSDEVQVAFAIDGKLSDAHERAFAQNGGPRKMGFLKSVAEAEPRRALEKLVGKPITRLLPSPGELAAARLEEAEAVAALAAIRPVAERISGKARRNDPSVAALAAAEERLQIAKFGLDAFEVRPIACFEVGDLLDEALANARGSLIVTTAGVQGAVVNGFRLRAMDRMIASGVRMEIETLWDARTEAQGAQFDPMSELGKRAARGALSLRKGTRNRFFFLIQDDELAVVSSRPFLGDMNKRSGFARVEGLVTRKPELVGEIRALALSAKGPARNGL